MPGASPGQNQSTPTTNPDNSAINQKQGNTADQQSEASSDRMLTKKIRQALIADKSLSTYGHNVKIITKDGSVTLKGPVKSEEEKQSIASKAESIVGSPDKVTNQLLVKQ
jgi:osmotically-inducible protein OsmY